MTYYTGQFVTAQKDDKSPVTDADIAANKLIVNALSKLAPQIPIIAEEDESLSKGGHELFWLVDPLDGTRAFVRGEPEFTVNIGLIYQNQPVLGVIYAPPQELMYYGSIPSPLGGGLGWGRCDDGASTSPPPNLPPNGGGAFRARGDDTPIAIHVRKPAEDGLVVVRSKSHPSPATEAFLNTIKIKEMVSGSSSIKFCTVAEGNADIYPRFGRTMEWDTAAGHAILNAAGGSVKTTDGKPFTYGKPGFENPHFIAYGW